MPFLLLPSLSLLFWSFKINMIMIINGSLFWVQNETSVYSREELCVLCLLVAVSPYRYWSTAGRHNVVTVWTRCWWEEALPTFHLWQPGRRLISFAKHTLLPKSVLSEAKKVRSKPASRRLGNQVRDEHGCRPPFSSYLTADIFLLWLDKSTFISISDCVAFSDRWRNTAGAEIPIVRR